VVDDAVAVGALQVVVEVEVMALTFYTFAVISLRTGEAQYRGRLLVQIYTTPPAAFRRRRRGRRRAFVIDGGG
jgi:hypothetical protein